MSQERRKKPGDHAGRASEVSLTNREAQWRSYQPRSINQAEDEYHGKRSPEQREPDDQDDE